jgi:hypothetical protein
VLDFGRGEWMDDIDIGLVSTFLLLQESPCVPFKKKKKKKKYKIFNFLL